MCNINDTKLKLSLSLHCNNNGSFIHKFLVMLKLIVFFHLISFKKTSTLSYSISSYILFMTTTKVVIHD